MKIFQILFCCSLFGVLNASDVEPNTYMVRPPKSAVRTALKLRLKDNQAEFEEAYRESDDSRLAYLTKERLILDRKIADLDKEESLKQD